MPFPVPIVEIAFSATPYAVNPTWTDVTQWVRAATVDRGRSDDWSDFDGSASVVLDNRDRRFDPFNASSPYAGNLLPRKQIRIRARTVEGGVTTTHDVFRGFVSGWSPEWTEGGKDSTVTLSCFDALQLLASFQLRADWADAYIRSTSPRHYWPCNEPVVPFKGGTLKDYGSVPQDIQLSTFASNGEQLAAGLVNRSVKATESLAGTTVFGPLPPVTNFTVSMWAIFDGTGTGGVAGVASNCSWGVGFDQSTNKYRVVISDAGSGLDRTFVSNNVYDGSVARMITFTFNVTTKAFQLYIDGVLTAVTATTAGAIVVLIGESTLLGTAQVQQLIIWPSIFADFNIRQLYLESSALLEHSAAIRVEYLMFQNPFLMWEVPPAALNETLLLDLTDDSPYLTAELRKVAASEGGPLFVRKNGYLVLFSQNQIRTQTRSIVSQATYGDGGLPIGMELQLSPDGDSLRNTVNITMSQGGVYRQENAASVAAHGSASMSVDTQVASLSDATRLANIITGWGGQVYPRLSPVDVVLDRDRVWASTLALELMDRITVNVKPPTGATVSLPMLVSRISHRIVPGQWQTTLEGSTRWAAVFILNQSTLGSTDLLG